ncbi:ATP-binding cassette domain-containing protein [Methylocucumis oryzae]|uniref:ABC transmembrane type-1 domain-containing protein n=1 Tax=Methylocucumis oryzae TaxID=1632867 RepID=A0A0F3INL2_9GAMM|nr:ATP-binding cassette domain-containing protein [Methylocucumis oryzae]KJV07159.1 hypothetical protein VZ94_06530 [Methylocucumis oryzae]
MSNSLDNAKSPSFDPDKLLEFILDNPKSKPLLIVASIACGLINALILVLINDAAKDFDNPELDARLFVIFLLLIALYFLSRRYITHKISNLVQTSIYQYRRRVLARVRELKLLAFEDIGKAQILSVLSEKTELISHGAHKLAEGFPVTILLVFSFVYIATISKMAFVLVFICMLCSMVSVQIMLKSLHKSLQQALTKEGEYLEYMQHVINGFNELKINRTKSDDLCVNYMDPLSEDTLQQNLAADITIVNVQLYAQNYFYILMAAIVFLLPQITQINGDEIMSVTTSVLYIIGPLVIVLDMIPSVARANVAVDFLRELENKLIAAQEVTEPAREVFSAPNYFDQLMLSKVVFHYPDTEQSRGFSVGPFELNIKRGELIFIRGGNGSGKSTFFKIVNRLIRT